MSAEHDDQAKDPLSREELTKYLPDVISFSFGTLVYRRTDPLQAPGIVVGILMRPGAYTYLVRWSDNGEEEHFDFEITSKRAHNMYLPEPDEEDGMGME